MSDTNALPRDLMARQMRRALATTRLHKPNVPTPAVRHPRDLVAIRDALLKELPSMIAEDTVSGETKMDYLVNLRPRDPYEVQMYFGTAEFADLFQEMLSTMNLADHNVFTQDIIREKGDHGTMLFAFDDRHVPMLAVEYLHGTYGSEETEVVIRHTPIAWGLLGWHFDADAPNPRAEGGKGLVKFTSMHMVHRFSDEYSHLDNIGHDMDDPHDLYPGNHGSAATAQLILMAWILLNPGPRLVQVSESKALEGLPPAVKRTYPKRYKHETVSVISLHAPMRKQIGEVTEARRTLQHRFIVRGHWRKQRVGTGRLDTRITYVAPYVKGPDGAPFIRREKVFKW